MSGLLHLVLFLTYLAVMVVGITVRKFVFQKDMSEHCRRRVVPSVFLGRHVVEAHSQILHFSRMELPYSCFISIRAESGNNIVLVVQLLSEKSLENACSKNPNQLLVYEMSETFGGYWGPLPDSVLRQDPVVAKAYTRKTTTSVKENVRLKQKYVTSTTMSKPTASPISKMDDDGNFVIMEVPLVEVSGHLEDNVGGQSREAFDPDLNFDSLYDVKPRPQGKYETSILPVVQFSIRSRDGRRGEEPRFDLEYDEPYTADSRLTLPVEVRTPKRRSSTRTNFYYNKLWNYEYKQSTFDAATETSHFRNNHLTPDKTIKRTKKINPSTRQDIEKNIRHINETNLNTNNISNVLEIISKMAHNNSAYLVPDWSSLVKQNKRITSTNVTQRFKTFTRTPLKLITYASNKNMKHFLKLVPKPTFSNDEMTETRRFTKHNNKNVKDSIATKSFDILSTNNITKARFFKNSTTELRNNSEPVKQKSEIKKYTSTLAGMGNYTRLSTSTHNIESEGPSSYETIEPLTGTMVGHESWENVVQAAPVMAVLLNKTVNASNTVNVRSVKNHALSTTPTLSRGKTRNKRKIHVIPIENARPHNLTTRLYMTTTTASSFKISDLQDFVQLVELIDDELQDRVALRYLRQYVGKSLFNLCGNGEPKARHVYLFNSSRIVMAINNLTLERMTVMLTPARTLLGSGSRCPATTLECQVYGTRICIDSMNACDGVPNCGAYDIYDEDRLMCGAAGGLQHNVYLAAVTFLALLLTVMYTVHYWLNRCVPRVSKAFFIYTDGAENILYLETIMRSPHDLNDSSRLVYHGTLPNDDDDLYPESVKKSGTNIIVRIMRACINCCKLKPKTRELPKFDIEEDFFSNYTQPRKMTSFAELELNKMLCHTEMTETAIQTGESLEMSYLNTLTKPDPVVDRRSLTLKDAPTERTAKVSTSGPDLDEDIQKHVNDLNMLKLFKDVRSEPVPSTSRGVSSRPPKQLDRGSCEEEELRNLSYDHHSHKQKSTKRMTIKAITPTGDVPVRKPESSKGAVKRLRFDEEAVSIPYDYKNDQESGTLQTSNIALADEPDLDKTEEPSPGTGIDFKRFWKTKKSKKKAAHLSVR